MRLLPYLSALVLAGTVQASAQCGGSFNGFVQDLKAEAVSRGHQAQTVDRFFASLLTDDIA